MSHDPYRAQTAGVATAHRPSSAELIAAVRERQGDEVADDLAYLWPKLPRPVRRDILDQLRDHPDDVADHDATDLHRVAELVRSGAKLEDAVALVYDEDQEPEEITTGPAADEEPDPGAVDADSGAGGPSEPEPAAEPPAAGDEPLGLIPENAADAVAWITDPNVPADIRARRALAAEAAEEERPVARRRATVLAAIDGVLGPPAG